ncbi:MAG: DUF4340 domain-containing protein [Eubacteriales bacterium]
MLQKQLKTIIIGLAAFLVLLGAYFFIIKPFFIDQIRHYTVQMPDGDKVKELKFELAKDETSKVITYDDGGVSKTVIASLDENKDPYYERLEEGESVGTTNRILITDHTEKDNIKSVAVHSPNGDFKVNRIEDIFYIEGAELISTNAELMSSFFVNTGYLLSMKKIVSTAQDYSEYGLDYEGDNVSSFTVERIDGSSYKIYVGDLIPTGAGYYVRMEGRDSVHVLDTGLGESVLVDKRKLLQAYVSTPISQNEYFQITNFKIYKNRELFVEIINDEIPEGSDALVNYRMIEPARYELNTDNYDAVLRTFISFAGESVADTEISDETLEKYGFSDENASRISFDFKDKTYNFLISPLNENGKYYITAVEFGAIVEVPKETLPFLDWDIMKFVSPTLFSMNINDIASISVEADGVKDEFKLEGTGQELVVTGNGKAMDLPNFRQYYKSLLFLELQDYSEEPEEGAAPMCTMRIVTDAGEELVYDFYFMTTRKCFYTVNGEGEFYVIRDSVLKLISDTKKVLAGDEVIAEDPN